MDQKKPLTLRELRERLDTLTDKQLDDTARWSGEESGGEILDVEVLEEEYIDMGEGAEPRSVYRDEPPDESEIVGRWPAGTVILRVDVLRLGR